MNTKPQTELLSSLPPLTDDLMPPKQKLATPEDFDRVIRLLQSWIDDGDEEEQRDTWEFLKKALDEDRPSYRKLFP